MTAKILFDEGHGNLTTPSPEAQEEQSFSKLVGLLGEEANFEFGESITEEMAPVSLQGCQVFVLSAPTRKLTLDEINCIWWFVCDGGGLLLLNNAEAFQSQLFSLNELAGRAGCRFGFYAANQPEALTGFAPHYITGGVEAVQVKRKTSGDQVYSRVESVEGNGNLQPICRNGYSQLLAVGAFGQGRVAVAGNTSMFSNKHIGRQDNQRLAINTFTWLARGNPFEIIHWTHGRDVELGQRFAFELILGNPTDEPTEISRISLESSVNDEISPPLIEGVVLYPDKGEDDVQRLRWEVEPQDILGEHTIRLRISYGQDKAVYRRMSSFSVVVPGHSHLTIVRKRKARRDIVVGEPFDVTGAGAVAGLRERLVSFTPELTHPAELRQTGDARPGALRWTFTANRPGTYPIALRVRETGQAVETHVVVGETTTRQIEEITTKYVKPLDDEVRRILPEISSTLTAPELAQVCFRLLPIEDYIHAAFPFEPAAQKVWDVIDAGYWDEMENDLVVADLLYNLAPMYTPRRPLKNPLFLGICTLTTQ